MQRSTTQLFIAVPEDNNMECAMFCERTTAHSARQLNVDCSPPHGLLYSSNQGQSVKGPAGNVELRCPFHSLPTLLLKRRPQALS
jgi:hypothetical protein